MARMNPQPLEVLQSRFGHSAFRPLQQEAVEALIGGRDLLMILPTGGGKSLCYQLPTLLMGGTTVVVSPLLALMHDQVTALRAAGMRAQMLSSMQDQRESAQIVEQLLEGALEFLYLSPERLNTDALRALLRRVRINFFVLDEAHCISEWGHEFRADYRALSQLREHFPHTPIAAFTATATDTVRHDIVDHLALNDPLILRGVLYRPNLFITCKHRIGDGDDQIVAFLKERKDQSGIIYALSRKSTERIAQMLSRKGFEAQAYHAGLEAGVRNEIYRAFVHDETRIIVATIAFGMGIDKSNIRFVLHTALPKTLENYYQEIGRAGRDGDDAEVVALFGASDVIAQKRFIEPLEAGPYRDHLLSKLDAMSRFAAQEGCRHQALARYFGDTIEPCGAHCDNCTDTSRAKRDISREAQMFLSALYRCGARFGKNYLIDVLMGSKEKRLLENGHDALSVYGIGKAWHKKQWMVLFERLLELEALHVGEFQVLSLTPVGEMILRGKQSVEIRSDRLELRASAAKKAPASGEYDERVFDALRTLRRELAQAQGVPPYVIFSDKTLKELSLALPQNEEQMLRVGGIGAVKFERYGEAFLALCRRYVTE